MFTPIIGTLAYVVRGGDVLMVHRVGRDDDQHLGKYNGLGGKLEAGEDVVAGLRRELREEANIEVDTLRLRGTISWPGFGRDGEDWLGFVFVVARNFRTAITFACDDEDCLVRARRNLYFIHKYELQKALGRVPDGVDLMIDLTSTSYVDLDNVDIINGFIRNARHRDVRVMVRGDIAERTAPLIDAPLSEVRFA